MRDLTELTDKTSSYELFTHVYWQIVTRRITGFAELVDYLSHLEEGSRKQYVLQTAFPLIRELHWGFFRELNAKTYPVLWDQLTRPSDKYPFAGELKRSMTITDIYCGFIDIHGYTAFSKSSKDAPMLRLLDVCIETDIKQICRDNHVMSNRARGDEIILLGTSAYDVVNTVINIADYFGDKHLTRDLDVVRKRRQDRVKLPELSVSAGVAGGKKYDSLVITATGDLSGPVVNTAARLQSRANRISSDDSRILITETVRIKFESEEKKQFAPMFSRGQMAFLDVGTFGFKGVDLRLTEVIIDSGEMYRLKYQSALNRFLETLSGDHWHDSVFIDLGKLIIAACTAMPEFKVTAAGNGGPAVFSNASLKSLSRRALDRFEEGNDFQTAVTALSTAVTGLGLVPEADHFLLLYAEAVMAEYRRIHEAYDRFMGKFAEEHRGSLLSRIENQEYENSVSGVKNHESIRSVLYSRVDVDKRRKLWRRLVKDLEPSLGESLYLGK